MSNKFIGDLGEQYATEFYVLHGHQIIHRNFHSRYGEIDVISLSKDKQLTFTEVKTRRSRKFGMPEEALTEQKIHKMCKTIHNFLQLHAQFSFYSWRIDLIAIELTSSKKLQSLKHYKNLSYG